MHRRQLIQNAALALGALTFDQQKIFSGLFIRKNSSGQQAWKMTMLTKEIGIFTERGGTIGFHLSKKGIIVVDAQFPEQSQHLIDELKKRNTKAFKLLINTHHHGDHTAGNISFKGIAEHVLAHQNSKKNQESRAKQDKTEDKQLYPDQTYTDTWCQKVAKEDICLYYFGPAHTDGDSVVHFEKTNIIHMGDLVFNRRHPFVDRAAGASMKNWITVLDKTTQKFDKSTVYVFGHAGEGYNVTGNADDLRAFGDYLGKTLQFVEGEIKAGKSKEDILKATSIPGADQWKGDGIQRPLTAAYEELTLKA